MNNLTTEFMPEQHNNEMRFALFRNDKGDNEKRPDYRGTIQVNGVEYELSAWIRTSKRGDKFMSGEVKPKRERATAEAAAKGFEQVKAAATAPQTVTDDVPF